MGGRGENQYSVATSELAAELGSVYRCSASNAVSVSSDRVEVTGTLMLITELFNNIVGNCVKYCCC